LEQAETKLKYCTNGNIEVDQGRCQKRKEKNINRGDAVSEKKIAELFLVQVNL